MRARPKIWSIPVVRRFFCLGLVMLSAVCQAPARAVDEQPAAVIQRAIDSVTASLATERKQLEENREQLFELIDRVASPLFDFDYIAKLILGTNWKMASVEQRKEFAHEIKRLLIATYATALFSYTGEEVIAFEETSVKQRKSVKFATVRGYFQSGDSSKFDMVYYLVQRPAENWKIYNLTVAELNVVLNYRNVIQASILKEGIAGMIASMKANNDKSYNRPGL